MLATHDIAMDRSTLAFWVGYAAQELKPLWHRLRQLRSTLRSSVSMRPRHRCWIRDAAGKTGCFWALSRDDRSWPDLTHLGSLMPMHRAAGPFMACACSRAIAASSTAAAIRHTRP